MDKPLHVFGAPVDEKALAQIENVMNDERAVAGALMADHHLGYSMPIGGVVAYQDAISPSGVGFDIACGNMCVKTDILYEDVRSYIPAFVEAINDRISFGLGRKNEQRVDHELFESPVWKELDGPGEPLKQKARHQLGTVGSGNHYVDLLRDEETGHLWVANHFGSRGFGHTVASGFLAIAQGKGFADRVAETEAPAVLDIGTPAGDLYVEAMKLAGRYAYAGREWVIEEVVFRVLGGEILSVVHNHHNYAWLENDLWVVRKGATPLTDQPSFIGGSMGDISVIVRGVPGEVGTKDIGALGSAPHGAGRVMSRTKAAGKFRKLTETRTRPDGSTYEFRVRRRDPATAAIDWGAAWKELLDRGIHVMGAGADESPGVYKDLRSVLAQHSNIEVLDILHPVGVVMAGEDVRDPYRD